VRKAQDAPTAGRGAQQLGAAVPRVIGPAREPVVDECIGGPLDPLAGNTQASRHLGDRPFLIGDLAQAQQARVGDAGSAGNE